MVRQFFTVKSTDILLKKTVLSCLRKSFSFLYKLKKNIYGPIKKKKRLLPQIGKTSYLKLTDISFSTGINMQSVSGYIIWIRKNTWCVLQIQPVQCDHILTKSWKFSQLHHLFLASAIPACSRNKGKRSRARTSALLPLTWDATRR